MIILAALVQRRRMGDRNVNRMRRHERHLGAQLLAGDVFRQLEVDRPGALLLGDAKSLADDRRDRGPADDLARHLGERLHRRDHVDDLKARLTGGHDRLLAGDHDHRHGAEMRVGGPRGEIEGARPEGRDAHAGTTGQAPVSRRHEGRRLLVPRQDQLDLGGSERLDDVEVLLARNPEDAVDPLVLQGGHKQVGSLHRVLLPSLRMPRSGGSKT
jgi:hypothetical protein